MNAGRLVRVPGGTVALVLSLFFVTGIRTSIAVTDTAGTQLEEVVVTGTSIKRINAETALPVQVLRRDDIARTGASTVEELFQGISAASSVGGRVPAQASGIGTGSIATISLRGLGSGRTLVLINGRRSAVYGGGSTGVAGSSVDISDPGALAAAKATEFTGQDFSTRSSIMSLGATGSRRLLALPAGPLSAAVGTELRRETFDYNPAAAVRGGDIAGQGGNQLPESASRNVTSGFLELNATVLKGLEIDAAVR